MAYSKRYLHTNEQPTVFSFTHLAQELSQNLPQVQFARVLGSTAHSINNQTPSDRATVPAHSDLDLALYMDEKIPKAKYLDTLTQAHQILKTLFQGVQPDIGILNQAGVVYQFESLKGRLLFARDVELYSGFFSLTCRRYEEQMIHFERQLGYRLEAQRTNQGNHR